jgi:hypothetical protein
MRNSEKDRAKRKDRKQRLEIKAKKMACKHERRTPYLVEDVIFGLIPCTPPKTICIDCGELITMLSNTVFGTGLDPQAKRNEAHKRHG